MLPPQMLQICLINSCVGRLFGLYFYSIQLLLSPFFINRHTNRPFHCSGISSFFRVSINKLRISELNLSSFTWVICARIC
jgi:hypothetical protein